MKKYQFKSGASENKAFRNAAAKKKTSSMANCLSNGCGCPKGMKGKGKIVNDMADGTPETMDSGLMS